MTKLGFPEAVECTVPVIVYICPTEGCGDHYASPDFRPDRADLDSKQTRRSQNSGGVEETHPRKQCPACRTRGKSVDRVPFIVTQIVPLNKVLKHKEKT